MIWANYTKNINVMDSAYKNELEKIWKWISENDLTNISLGKKIIDGDNLYVNILDYDTKDEADCIWEAHKQYIDLHYIISGCEVIGISNVENMEVGDYDDEKDYVHIKGDADAEIRCKEGTLLLLYPEDAHKTAITVKEPKKVKKCVFKIKIHE